MEYNSMELNGNIVSLNLKQIVEVIEIKNEFDTSICGSSSTAKCRVCLEKCNVNKMCSIFDTIKTMNICDMIMSCASVQIMEGDGLPSMICDKCTTNLKISWEFKFLCENSDASLRQMCTNLENMQVIPNNIDSYSFVPTEQEQNIYSDKKNISSQSSQFSECGSTNIKNKYSELINNKNRTAKRREKPKICQCDVCGKAFHRKEYLTRHIRIHTGEKPYKCHLCDKKFVSTGHLSTHMRAHTGQRPHSCTLCPKAFATKQELQKHTLVHSGIKPFACKMCDKKFGTSSNLYAHLKHHTGEKNFTCEQCGKAFYTKQELKQHFVVHTGEKMFACVVCSKRFAQLAHLRRHLKQTHKKDNFK